MVHCDAFGDAIMSCITPYLCVHDSAAAIEFYTKVFGATEQMRLADPGGRIQHAEVSINGAILMFADEFPEMGFLSPKSLGGAHPPVILGLHVDDVDKIYTLAVEAGSKPIKEPADQFYGERTAQVQDPFGHVWALMERKEQLSNAEIVSRFEKLMKG